jgi:hypothetical protein
MSFPVIVGIITSKLETWHICVMTKGLDAACPGDATNTIIAIAPDKVRLAHLDIRSVTHSAGSFRHQNRPKLRLDPARNAASFHYSLLIPSCYQVHGNRWDENGRFS